MRWARTKRQVLEISTLRAWNYASSICQVAKQTSCSKNLNRSTPESITDTPNRSHSSRDDLMLTNLFQRSCHYRQILIYQLTRAAGKVLISQPPLSIWIGLIPSSPRSHSNQQLRTLLRLGILSDQGLLINNTKKNSILDQITQVSNPSTTIIL